LDWREKAATPKRIAAPNQGTVVRRQKLDGELEMTAIETFAEREKQELDLQLDHELEGTFPASDPPKITRFSTQPRGVAARTRKRTTVSKDDS
jgi:hypothetical protein